MYYPSQPMGFWRLFLLTFKVYPRVFKKSLGINLVFAFLAKLSLIPFLTLALLAGAHNYLEGLVPFFIVFFLVSFLGMGFYFSFLYANHKALINSACSFRQTLRYGFYTRFGLLFNLTVVTFLFSLVEWACLFLLLMTRVIAGEQLELFKIIAILWVLFAFFSLVFVPFIVVTEEKRKVGVFYHIKRLLGVRYFLYALGIMILSIIALFFISFPMLFPLKSHLSWIFQIFELISMMIIALFLNCFGLLLLNDLGLRAKAKP